MIKSMSALGNLIVVLVIIIFIFAVMGMQGGNLIDIWNLRLELRLKLRQGLRTHLGNRLIRHWVRVKTIENIY